MERRLDGVRPYLAAPVLGLVAIGCSGPPLPPPRPAPTSVDVVPTATPVAAVAAARWVQSDGATAVGPTIGAGTLVLLGGRRALIGKDGGVEVEKSPCPEAIVEITVVPSSSGDRRIVGRGLHGVYRFDDPLGAPAPLARSEVELAGIGAGPGLVAVWDTQSELPRFLDLESGKPRALPGLPALPLRALAFRDAREGAAIFHGAGLATTTDGGATWKTAEGAQGDGLRMNGLRLRGDEIRAFSYAVGRDARVDPPQARLGNLDELAVTSGEPPLLQWIRVTGRDPLEAAVTSGALSPSGHAVVASHGLMARVDLSSGMLLELAEFARGGGVNACSVGRTSGGAWVGCALSEENENDLYDPFGVLALPLAGKLGADRPAIARNGEAELRTSPSGGAMLVAPCNADDDGDACVRQPDGKWVTLDVDADLLDRGVGPLADGKIAFLRGLYEGDDPPGSDAEAPADAPPGARAPYVVVADATGAERRFAASLWSGRPGGDFRVQSPIEEDTERALHFALGTDEGAFVFIQPRSGEGAVFRRQDGARTVRLEGDHGVAVGPRKVEATLDGGRTFTDIKAPPRVLEAVTRLGPVLDEPGAIAVSEVGIKIESQLRIGWGPGDDRPPPAQSPAGAPLEPRPPAPAGGAEQLLQCKAEGAAPGLPPLVGSHQIRALLATPGAPPKGQRRGVSTSATARSLEAIALLEEQGPDKPGSMPATWTLRWHDPLEIGGKAHTWTGPAPKQAPWGASLRTVSAQGARALFSIRAGGKYLLVRTKPGGGIETVESGFAELPSSEVVFGTERGEPIAWLHETQLFVWSSGEAPRPIGSLAQNAVRSLGQPTKEGVPVFLGSSDWALLRTFPIPPKPADKGKDKATARAAAPAPALDGWAPVVNVRREAGRLPACAAAAKGLRIAIARSQLDATVDGVATPAQLAVYQVRLAGGEACVAGVSALVTPAKAKAPGAATPSGDAGAARPVTFVRADLAARRAEGGERGLGGPGAVRKLSCSLAARQ